MNKLRRKEIFKIIQILHKILSNIHSEHILNIITELESVIDYIQIILDEEECVMDNIPENLQNGYRYEESENACDNLNDAISELEEIDDEYDKIEIIEIVTSVIQCLNNCI
jgi:hypothetical protein